MLGENPTAGLSNAKYFSSIQPKADPVKKFWSSGCRNMRGLRADGGLRGVRSALLLVALEVPEDLLHRPQPRLEDLRAARTAPPGMLKSVWLSLPLEKTKSDKLALLPETTVLMEDETFLSWLCYILLDLSAERGQLKKASAKSFSKWLCLRMYTSR